MTVYNFVNKDVYCFSDLEGMIPSIDEKTPEHCKYVINLLNSVKPLNNTKSNNELTPLLAKNGTPDFSILILEDVSRNN